MSRHARPVELTARQRAILGRLSRSRTLPKRIAEKVAFVLESAAGRTCVAQAHQMGVDAQRSRRWRKRWFEAWPKLGEAEARNASDDELEALIREVLEDERRSGTPPKFSAEQWAQIVALACKEPKELGLPVTHWTPGELARVAVKAGIVASISSRHVARFLEEAAIRPHKSQYWLNPRIDDPEQHARQVAAVCDVYHQAAALEAEGVHVVSCDEKTSIQALERVAPTKPTRPGLDERREFEYKRHGTLCLIANLVVATGKILAPTLSSTRDEEDFARHIEETIATDPTAGWIFVADNLTTHCSESLVRLVVKCEGIDVALGGKRKGGILFDVESRRQFLAEKSHRIRFVYTPKHCSWLNQVENSILVRRALKRASFRSTEELRAAILAFIAYFNDLLAKPFRWTYTGRPLAA